jgi:hypothetical protein
MVPDKSRAVKNVERAQQRGFFGIKAGRYLSLSQLEKLAALDINFAEGEKPDGFLFQLGKIEGLFQRYTIELIPYQYDRNSPGGIKYTKHVDGEREIEGHLQINLGLQKPDDPNYPRRNRDNNYWIDNEEGGGGLGASQAYPTPGH